MIARAYTCAQGLSSLRSLVGSIPRHGAAAVLTTDPPPPHGNRQGRRDLESQSRNNRTAHPATRQTEMSSLPLGLQHRLSPWWPARTPRQASGWTVLDGLHNRVYPSWHGVTLAARASEQYKRLRASSLRIS